jgi:fucose permease
VVGRLVGSRLVRWVQSEWVVLVSVVVCGVGFLIHWWASSSFLTTCGLFISGLGVANLYPQTLVLAVGVASGQTDQASARASLASGMAILILPLFLGALADQIGIRFAYGVIAILLLLAGMGIILIKRFLVD